MITRHLAKAQPFSLCIHDSGANNPGTNSPSANTPGTNNPGTNSPGANNPGAVGSGATWQRSLSLAIRDWPTLLQRLDLEQHPLHVPPEVLQHFPIRVTESYLNRIERGNPRDPLLLQIFPQAAEAIVHAGESVDPVGDHAALRAPGLLHKYAGRALLLVTGNCAVHCRYCFRRGLSYRELGAAPQLESALARLREDESISEIILSGGDPLTLTNARLGALLERLAAIPQLQRLRIHSRLPIVLPERIDAGLLDLLQHCRLPTVLVVHANHPREWTAPTAPALRRLHTLGITLLNQSVLLAGINDDLETLCSVQEKGFALGVLPYYLHMLDPAPGTAHFAVSESRALALLQGLRQRLPGYLVPRLVRERPGGQFKETVS